MLCLIKQKQSDPEGETDMAKRMMALVLALMMLMTQCVAAQAADFTTWNKGMILTDPKVYFGSDKYRFGGTSDDRNADFKWN